MPQTGEKMRLNLKKIELYCILNNVHSHDEVPYQCLSCSLGKAECGQETPLTKFQSKRNFRKFELGWPKDWQKENKNIYLGCEKWMKK